MKLRHVLLSLTAALGVTAAIGTVSASASSSAVNDYINSNNVGHASITKSVWGGFPKYKYNNGKGHPQGVVIHETGNPSSTIYNEIAYMKNNYKNAFVHSFVDSGKIINIANTDYLAWGVGYPGNGKYVQFEQVEMHSKSAFAKEVSNAAYYTAYLLHEYGLKPNNASSDGKGTVWSHAAVAKFQGGSDHTDPVSYYSKSGKKWFGQSYTMGQFYQLVLQYYNNDSTSHTNSGSGSSSSSSSSKNAKVKYNSGYFKQTATLAKGYNKNNLWTHVKGSRADAKKVSWYKTSAKTGKKVYLDSRGLKDNGTTWYRIRFSKSNSAKKYWVWSKSLTMPKVQYHVVSEKHTVKANASDATYNHVYNSDYLGKRIASASSLQNQSLDVNNIGTYSWLGKSQRWYRVNANGMSQWVNANQFLD